MIENVSTIVLVAFIFYSSGYVLLLIPVVFSLEHLRVCFERPPVDI